MADAAREIGATGLRVPPLCFGTSSLGGMPDTFGYDVGEARALDTLRAILALPDGFLDTSRVYAMGRSEARIGTVVRELGGWPAGRILSTKLDRDMETRRFEEARARRSFELFLPPGRLGVRVREGALDLTADGRYRPGYAAEAEFKITREPVQSFELSLPSPTPTAEIDR